MSAGFTVDLIDGPVEFEIFSDGHVDTVDYDITYDETVFALGGAKSMVLEYHEHLNKEPHLVFAYMGLTLGQMLKIANVWVLDFFDRFGDKFAEVVHYAKVEYPPFTVESMRETLISLSNVAYGQNDLEAEWIHKLREVMFRNAITTESNASSFKFPIDKHIKAFGMLYSALGHLCRLSWVYSTGRDDVYFSYFGYDPSFYLDWNLIGRGIRFAACQMSETAWPKDMENSRMVGIALQVLGMED